MSMKNNCGTCTHFKGRSMGHCHLNPPQIFWFDAGDVSASEFPEVTETDHCGQWTPKEIEDTLAIPAEEFT